MDKKNNDIIGDEWKVENPELEVTDKNYKEKWNHNSNYAEEETKRDIVNEYIKENIIRDEYGIYINKVFLVLSAILAAFSLVGLLICLATIDDAFGRYGEPILFIFPLMLTIYCISGSLILLWFARTGKNIAEIRIHLEKYIIK